MPKVVAVIPARYASSRLPGKPLAMIDGKPMIQRVYEGALGSGVFASVLVATDDRRILEAVTRFGGKAVMTRADHASGTDRVAEVAAGLDAEIIVNIQGDLPFVDRALVEPPVTAMVRDPSIPMATVSVPILDRSRWLDPNVVKVVTDEAGFALYFSRAPIPARRENPTNGSGSGVFGQQHVGLYAVRREFLLRFAAWPPTALEEVEKLEQLRALERRQRIFVARISGQVIEVDTAADLERANERGSVGEAGKRGAS
jgi:3-deoxy-manno-octulosonate cytidylyltransferase (CMP-KDO synthetase)